MEQVKNGSDKCAEIVPCSSPTHAAAQQLQLYFARDHRKSTAQFLHIYQIHSSLVPWPSASSAFHHDFPKLRRACGSGSTSTTADARSLMKVGSVPSAGTRSHQVIPASLATSAYSISISSSVSMCSETKEIGTTTRAFSPCAARSSMASSVYGWSHVTGPTFDWYARGDPFF